MSVCLSGNLLIIMRTTVILQSSAPMFLCMLKLMLKVHSTWSIFSLFLQSDHSIYFWPVSSCSSSNFLQCVISLLLHFPHCSTKPVWLQLFLLVLNLCPEYNKYDPRSTCSSSLAPSIFIFVVGGPVNDSVLSFLYGYRFLIGWVGFCGVWWMGLTAVGLLVGRWGEFKTEIVVGQVACLHAVCVMAINIIPLQQTFQRISARA